MAIVETDAEQRSAMFFTCRHDRAEHAILDVLRAEMACSRFDEAGVFQKDDPVAGGEFTNPARCLEIAGTQ